MENENAPLPRVVPSDDRNDITVRIERSSMDDQTSPLDIGQIHDDDKRDLVLVAGNLFSLLNSTIALVFCLLEQHYVLMQGGKFEPSSWQLGLIFGPILGYNFLAWVLRAVRGR